MWYQSPAKASAVAGGFFRYPFITVLPRSMISPMVAPSRGTGRMVAGSITATASSVG